MMNAESTSESRHKRRISFRFSWLEDAVGVVIEAWENCFFFLSMNVHCLEFWLDILGATSCEESGNLKTSIGEAQQGVRITGNGPSTHVTRSLLLKKVQKFTVVEQRLRNTFSREALLLSGRHSIGGSERTIVFFKEPALFGIQVAGELHALRFRWLAIAVDNFAEHTLINAQRFGDIDLMETQSKNL